MKAPAVYMLTSERNGTLYIGVTSDLIQRIWQHREGLADGFTKQYGVKMLVWYEQHDTMGSAIMREKALKKWNRNWKMRLIEKANPEWRDLWHEITGQMAAQQSAETVAPSSPSALVGDPAQTQVQSARITFGATQNKATGFPPRACGNDGDLAQEEGV